MKAGDKARAEALKAEVAAPQGLHRLGRGDRAPASTRELDAALAAIPNMPLDEVPDGKDEHGNVEMRALGREARTSTSSRASISTSASGSG